MRIAKSSLFDAFHCIASRCPDSCCKEWGVQVDEASASYYRALSGDLGNRLREVLQTEDGETVMTIIDGRCPMWRADGLCRIQAELGEGALCKTCREFPRLTHDYGDFVELGLELSCPEAAWMILNAAPSAQALICAETLETGTAEYDEEAMAVLLQTRKTMLDILTDTSRPVNEALTLALLYGYEAQAQLDGDEGQPFVPEMALETARQFAKPGDAAAMLDFFLGLEILTPEWEAMLRCPVSVDWEEGFRSLAVYFVWRYWLQAVSDYDLSCRVKFLVIACLLVKTLGGDLLVTARRFSKEIENDADNVEAILDAAYSHPAFTDDKLLGMLLQ